VFPRHCIGVLSLSVLGVSRFRLVSINVCVLVLVWTVSVTVIVCHPCVLCRVIEFVTLKFCGSEFVDAGQWGM